MSNAAQNLWSAGEAAIITGGSAQGDWSASGVCLKESELRAGDLFFASRDDDIARILAKGAAAVAVPHGMDVRPDWPVLRIASAFEALQSLARAARFRTHSLVVSVQGTQERASMTKALGAVSDIYAAGRHLSTALAALPELCDFSMFGFAPSLRADVVVINDAAQAIDHAVLESMPDNGIALVNADDPNYLDIIIQARGAGVRNILTFGAAPESDARLVEKLSAANGTQLTCSILGEEIALQTQGRVANLGALLAAMLLTKLSDMSLQLSSQMMLDAACVSEIVTQSDENLSLMPQKNAEQEAIFRVKSLVDLGRAGRTLVLDRGTNDKASHIQISPRDFGLPSQLDRLNLVCASKKISIFKNARKAVEGLFNARQCHSIVPDVLCPGDYLVFKSAQDRPRAIFSGALRVTS